MLQIHDIRESRVYQEAKEKGAKDVIERAVPKLAAKKMSAEGIACILELDVEMVRQAMTNGSAK